MECEKYIGFKIDMDGGRFDIYFIDGINYIVIENKIYVID